MLVRAHNGRLYDVSKTGGVGTFGTGIEYVVRLPWGGVRRLIDPSGEIGRSAIAAYEASIEKLNAMENPS